MIDNKDGEDLSALYDRMREDEHFFEKKDSSCALFDKMDQVEYEQMKLLQAL